MQSVDGRFHVVSAGVSQKELQPPDCSLHGPGKKMLIKTKHSRTCSFTYCVIWSFRRLPYS